MDLPSFLLTLPKYIDSLIAVTELVAYFTGKKFIRNNYRLRRDFKVGHVTTSALPVDVVRKYDAINEEEILRKKYGEEILNFIETINKEIPEVNQSILLNNFNTISIKDKKFRLRNFISGIHVGGVYSPIYNSIELDSRIKIDLTIYHELFHAITAVYDKEANTVYCGFSQDFKNGRIVGTGLNEGYTQYLAEKYFNADEKAYPFEKQIAATLEKIIGESKMKTYYFNADLKGLIEFLKQYVSEEEAYQFINSLDFISGHIDDKYLLPSSRQMLDERLKSVNSFLIRLVLSKMLVENPDIENRDDVRIVSAMLQILLCIPRKLKVRGKTYELSNEELIKEAYASVFEKHNTDSKLSSAVK